MVASRKKLTPVDESSGATQRGLSTPGVTPMIVVTFKSGKKVDCKVVKVVGNLVLHHSPDSPKLYDIWHPLSQCAVLCDMPRAVASRYLSYLVAGGLAWAMTSQPRLQDANIPEVKRGLALRDLRRLVRRHLTQAELDALLAKEGVSQ